MDELRDLVEEVEELIKNSVSEGNVARALELLEIYRDDHIALDLLREYYDSLPGVVDDAVMEIRVMGHSKGIYLLLAVTGSEGYVYLSSAEGLELQGSLSEGIWDPEVGDYFQLEDLKNLPGSNDTLEELPIYEPLSVSADVCPACYAHVGEYHELGCPVEICPWCGGQLIHCNCRFEQLGQDTISDEADLIRLESLLEAQGRIPYDQDQRPSYPSVG